LNKRGFFDIEIDYLNIISQSELFY